MKSFNNHSGLRGLPCFTVPTFCYMSQGGFQRVLASQELDTSTARTAPKIWGKQNEICRNASLQGKHAFHTGTPMSQLWPVSVKTEWWGMLITMVLKNAAVYRLINFAGVVDAVVVAVAIDVGMAAAVTFVSGAAPTGVVAMGAMVVLAGPTVPGCLAWHSTPAHLVHLNTRVRVSLPPPPSLKPHPIGKAWCGVARRACSH